MEKKELLEYFIDRDISELYGDFSDDGDGELELTDCGDEVAELIMEIADKAREEGYRKGREDQQHLDGLFYGTTVATTTTLEEGWILKHKKKVEEELSKLTTK